MQFNYLSGVFLEKAIYSVAVKKFEFINKTVTWVAN